MTSCTWRGKRNMTPGITGGDMNRVAVPYGGAESAMAARFQPFTAQASVLRLNLDSPQLLATR
jgi:hypothetical protein